MAERERIHIKPSIGAGSQATSLYFSLTVFETLATHSAGTAAPRSLLCYGLCPGTGPEVGTEHARRVPGRTLQVSRGGYDSSFLPSGYNACVTSPDPPARIFTTSGKRLSATVFIKTETDGGLYFPINCYNFFPCPSAQL